MFVGVSCVFPFQIENIMASLDAGLSDCDVIANGVTSSSHNPRVASTTTTPPPQQQTATGDFTTFP